VNQELQQPKIENWQENNDGVPVPDVLAVG